MDVTARTERRLAAIMSADVVGYSRLMAERGGNAAYPECISRWDLRPDSSARRAHFLRRLATASLLNLEAR